ncbi:MAG: TonB-dependent receptor plug domain-containing protein [Lysobacterales bacterium]
MPFAYGLNAAVGACGLLVVIFAAACAPMSLRAQTPEAAAQTSDSLEEVVVTGSRIKRRDFTSPSPIASLEASFLEFTPQPTLEEVLNQMPQVQPDCGRSANNPGDGTSRLNLRGLGSQRTLVMLNGRRLAPSGAGSAVDVNNLPKALVERVEVITGGASTVYGSDAVAGVVNFITRKNIDGLNVNASTYVTEQGDSEVHDFNALYGSDFSDGRGSLRIFAGALERKASFAGDREISQVPFFDDLQGNILASGSGAIPEGRVGFPRVDLGNGPTQARFDAGGNLVPFVRPDDLYNFAPINFLQTPLTRYTGGVFVDYDVSDRMETYLELTFTRNETSRSLAPVPLGAFFAINLDNPILTPQFRQIATDQLLPAGPDTVLFGLLRRLQEVGLREIDRNQDYLRLVAGVRGSINDSWDYDAWITYTDTDEELLQSNGVSASRVQQGLLVDPLTGQCFDPSGGCVPVNLFGLGNLSAQASEFLRLAPLVSTSQRTQKSESIRGTLNIANLFDTDPPFVADQARANNTDSALYDIFGRAFQAGVSLNFR